MNVKALVLTGATVGVAVVTLVALNLVAPISHAQDSAPQGVTADAVFAASIAEPGSTASTEPMMVAQADTTEAPVAESEAPAAPAPTMATVTSNTPPGGSCAMGAAPSGQTLATADAPASAAPAATDSTGAASSDVAAAPAPQPVIGGACSTGIVDPNQKPVIASGLPGSPAAPAESLPAAEVAAESQVPAEAEPAPVAEPAPAPEPVVAAAPEPVVAAEPAPAPKPKAAAPKAAAKPKAPAAPKVAPPETKQAWWPAKAAGKLNLTYAGSASFTKAIVLMFDGTFENATAANEHIKVTNKAGKPVEGQWLVAKGNPQMLLYSVPPGVYSVAVGEGLTDKGNRAIAAAASGAVFVP